MFEDPDLERYLLYPRILKTGQQQQQQQKCGSSLENKWASDDMCEKGLTWWPK